MKIVGVMVAALLLVACSTSSKIVTGNVRPALDPAQVRIYSKPPARFEEIGVIEANSRGSMAFGMQAQTDKVIERLKVEAAALGANGVLLEDFGKTGGATLGTGLGSATGSSSGSGISLFGASIGLSTDLENRVGKGRAIFVIEE